MKYSQFLRISLCTFMVTSCGVDSSSELAGKAPPRSYVRVPIQSLTAEFVAATGFIHDHRSDDEYALGYIKGDALQNLPKALANTTLVLDEKAWARQAYDLKSLQPVEEESVASKDRSSAEDYHNYDALTVELKNLADAHPDLARLESAGKSLGGRELWYMRIGANLDRDDAGPTLLSIANMHGDETVGREMMVYLIRKLLNTYGSSTRVKQLVDHANIFIMPSLNPDGFESGDRWNGANSDLNRDFPDFTSDPNDTEAGREVETKAVMKLHQRHHFDLAMNLHGGTVCFNIPWDTKSNSGTNAKFGDDGVIKSIGREFADANPTMLGNNSGSFDRGLTYGYEWYEVDGGMQDWSIYYRGSLHATVELSHVKYPDASRLPGFWSENEEALTRFLERGLMGVHLKVTDSEGTLINRPTVRLSTGNRSVAYPSAYVHRVSLAGKQSVTVSAPGFQSKTLDVMAESFAGDYQTVVLNR